MTENLVPTTTPAAAPESPSGTSALVEQHLGLATAIARHYRDRGVEVEDLEQVAALALVKAAGRFDRSAGDFAPFAAATVRGEVKRHFRDRAWAVRPPRAVQDLKRRLSADVVPDRVDRTLLRRLADRHDATVTEITEALTASDSFLPVSLDHRLDADRSLGDLVPAPADRRDAEGHLDLWRCLRKLPAEDRNLLRWWFFDGDTQTEIADRLGVAQMTVSRRIRKVLTTLRDELGIDPPAA